MMTWSWRWSISVTILVLFILVHLFFAIDRDAGAFLTIAQGILDGYKPYRDFFDHKPPGIYYTLAVVLALSSRSVWGAKVFLLLIALVVLGFIARVLKIDGDSRTVWWGTCLGALGWVVYQGYTLVTETIVACLVAVSLAELLRPNPRWGIAGVLVGLATLFKQPAVLFLLPVGFYALLVHPKSLWKALVGFAGVLAISVSLLIISGIALPAFQQTVLANIGYIQNYDLREIIKGDFSLYFAAAPLWTAALLPLLIHPKDPKVQFLASMLIASWLPAFLRPTSHYLLPAVPVGAILAAWGAREVEQSLSERLFAVPSLLIIFPLGLFLVFSTLAAFSHLYLFQQIRAGHILADLTSPDEPVLVIGAEPQYYFLAHRYPPGKDLYLLPVNYHEQKETEMLGYLRSGQVNIVAVADTPPTALYASKIRAFVETHCWRLMELPSIHLTIWKCEARK